MPATEPANGPEIVPFGKYKGQPVEVLTADTDYCEWLTGQPWFRERFRDVYNVVINYGGEPQDSPEHNQMQAKFLDEAWCVALADRLGLRKGRSIQEARAELESDPLAKRFHEYIDLTEYDMWADDAKFEVNGWDVIYEVKPAGISRRMISLPKCVCHCQPGEHGYYCKNRKIEGHPGKVRTDATYFHCDDECPWKDDKANPWLRDRHGYFPKGRSVTVRVELKPDLGDDYPSVLRQVTRYPDGGGRRTVIVRRAAFEHVTWEQVVKIFGASEITLLMESEIG